MSGVEGLTGVPGEGVPGSGVSGPGVSGGGGGSSPLAPFTFTLNTAQLSLDVIGFAEGSGGSVSDLTSLAVEVTGLFKDSSTGQLALVLRRLPQFNTDLFADSFTQLQLGEATFQMDEAMTSSFVINDYTEFLWAWNTVIELDPDTAYPVEVT